ncbi:MAG: carbamate kinase [Deltaproteobacteria bacterium]|nr:carbamate kinase [Deltaproteobacteria bacterium]
MSDKRLAVVAIGGNSLISDPRHQTVEDQYETTRKTTSYIADLMDAGYRVVITHGNGPQVGFILLRSEAAKKVIHEIPVDTAVADTQGGIGYHIQQTLLNELARRGNPRPIATVTTQVLVDRNDPCFQSPNKPIGVFYTREESDRLARERGWAMKEDSGRGWRRVVPSPQPLEILEFHAIQALIEAGVMVVAVGGGGIPVYRNEAGDLRGVAAVIDKDRASSLLATKLGAEDLIISTAVDKVSLRYKTPEQQDLDRMTLAEAKRYMAEGHFAPGSMKPKIEAAIAFIENGGKRVIICSPETLAASAAGNAGTTIVP